MHVEPGSVDGILADFGVSSLQLDEAHRGFSFMADGPLDMRQDTRSGPTAAQVVNEASERELADLIYEYGDERRSRRIARAIVRGRPITTTGQLVPNCCISRPGNETGQDSPGDADVSGAPDLCESRAGRNHGRCWRPHPSCLSPPDDWSSSAFTRLKIASRKTVCATERTRESGKC